MGNTPQHDPDEAIRLLAEKLRDQRRALEDRAPDEVRSALRQTLDAAFKGLGESEVGNRLERLRAHLVEEARSREHRLGELQAECQRLSEEKDALARELERAREGRPAAPAESSPGAVFDRYRDALQRAMKGEEDSTVEKTLSGSEVRLFRLTLELLRFALNFETSINNLIATLQLGPGGDTRYIKHQKKLVEQRFRACLEDREGSVVALKGALERTAGFIVALHEAHDRAVRRGVPALLSKVNPQPIFEQTPGFGMAKYKDAWKSLSEAHDDLKGMPPSDVWESFFDQYFKERLSEYLQS